MPNKTPKPILFCDFDGVLCHDRYWRSLPADEYTKVQKILFGGDSTLINEWMRGKHSSEEINEILSNQSGIPYDRLWDTFVGDCKSMKVPKEELQKLNDLRKQYTVMLVTSNMDCFTRFTSPTLSLGDYFDHICNSHDEGMLKTDNDGELYLKLANGYGVPMQKCTVFDDSNNVREIFTKLGGTACLVTKEQGLAYHLGKLGI